MEKIFATFESHYMGLWLDRVRGCDLGAIKADWGRKLAGFMDSPYALAYGLNHLEEYDRPPTLSEFIRLCRRAPAPDNLPRLPHKLTEEDVQRAKNAARVARQAVERAAEDKALEWARTPRTELQLSFIRAAALKHPGIAAELAALIDAGRVTADGKHLLYSYRGAGIWIPSGYVEATP